MNDDGKKVIPIQVINNHEIWLLFEVALFNNGKSFKINAKVYFINEKSALYRKPVN